jgi:hypothetical protein
MKQSAIEWLLKELKIDIGTNIMEIWYRNNLGINVKSVIEQAKEIEKKQLGEAWDNGIQAHEKRGYNISRSFTDFDDYYDETYGK